MGKLTIKFFDRELCEIQFSHALLSSNETRFAIRGKTAGAMLGAGTFQWTSAVQALSYLLLLSVYNEKCPGISTKNLSGGRGSMAISLDYAISKQVQWLQDVFGVDSRGQLGVRRAILRTNPNCKRPGPVVLGLNEKFITADSIKVEIDGNPDPTPECIWNLAESVAEQFEINRQNLHAAKYSKDDGLRNVA